MEWVRLLVGILFLGGGVGILSWTINGLLAREKARWKAPFTEKMVRPAGESLRIRIEELRSDLADQVGLFAVYLMLPGALVLLNHTLQTPLQWIVISVFSAGPAGMAIRRWPKVKAVREDLRKARLGFDGERYVAEELNQLMRRGYRVFHDFVVDRHPGEERTFNIDHVLVGPEGVFAIETKTRSSPKDQLESGETPRVSVDGERLSFHDGPQSDEAIKQAKRGAKEIRDWLVESGQPVVEVRPMVVIPGWFVECKDYWKSGVQSAKGVARRIPRLGRQPLSAAQIEAIGNCIEMHCRNVEGGS